MIEQSPSIKAAMYVVPAGSELPPHRDPFAGSLRYHLGLITPNSEDCYIDVDGEHYYWRDGEAVLFDETYIHQAKNNTDKDRLIFFCDVKRPMKNNIGDWLNSFFSWFILAAAKLPNNETDSTGNLNKVQIPSPDPSGKEAAEGLQLHFVLCSKVCVVCGDFVFDYLVVRNPNISFTQFP